MAGESEMPSLATFAVEEYGFVLSITFYLRKTR